MCIRTSPPCPPSTTFRRDGPSPSALSTPCCARLIRSMSPSASSTPTTTTASTPTGPSIRSWCASRGICTVENDRLQSVREALKVQLYPDGTLKDLAEDRSLPANTVVSMNFWGFAPSIFPRLKDYFEYFLRNEAGENLKAECLLPLMVESELQAGRLEVSVLHSADHWFGMTYHEDRQRVAGELQKLHDSGAYPQDLTK